MADAGSFDPRLHPRKLNLGCGFDRREGYLNVDLNEFHEPDLVADICDLSVLPSGYYEEVVAQDLLEHIERTRSREVLAEWNRVLAVGGRLRLRTTRLEGIFELLRRPEFQSIEKQEQLIQCLFGTQAYTGDFHHTAFTEPLIHHYLASTGFRIEKLEVRDCWLFDVTARKRTSEIAAIDARRDLLSIPGDDDFLDRLYRELLGRAPDPEGLSYYRDGLASGRLSRRQVLDAVLSSHEYRRRVASSQPEPGP